MKYVVSRTNLYGVEEKPCEEATLFNGTRLYRCTLKTLQEIREHPYASKWFFRESMKNHKEDADGCTCESDGTFWVVETSIEDFAKKYGDIVVKASDCIEYPIELEIYDTYRE